MKYLFAGFLLLMMMFVGSQAALAAEEKDPCASRVPADQLSAAKAEKNPYAGDAAAIAEGKMIFEGKGTCFTCHGMNGDGKGEAGAALDPLPRDFTNGAFHDCKTDGEMLWVISNGSPGTGMIPAVATGILTEEEAQKVQAFERTFRK